MSDAILQVSNLEKHFRVGRGKILRAVDNVSFAIQRGKTLGLVGESGCGKTTVGRTLLRIYEPDGGTIVFDGQDISKVTRAQAKALTRKMQMIFQDPYASLNPFFTVGEIIAEGLELHKLCANAKERRERVYELLEMVGLNKEHANRFAHEFSGGQRQRIGIARAFAVRPEFIMCDEPISALDVSIQAQIVNLLVKLQREMGMTYLFIAHDLAMVKHISDRIAVMYLGSVVELATSDELYAHTLHPYSQALLSAIPIPSSRQKMQRVKLIGELQSPIDPEPGCRFAKRCLYAREGCTGRDLALRDFGSGHFCACCRAGALEEQTPSK